MAEVTLTDVSKQFGDVWAVREVSLTVQDREFVVLVGPSGCGKSTTLRMVAGLEEISAGDLYIGGRRVNDVAPKDRDIAMVFQSYALYPHMSVFENMAFGLRLQKLPKSEIEHRVTDAAKILGLTDLLNRKPREMSGGQRQRVAMGRAIVRRPAVFLFDEPLSNLDARLRVQMRTEIARLHRQLDSTSIYVTHDQVEAMTLADRIVVMNEGRVQQVGSPMELYHTPCNLFVATFIGSPAMNLVPCQLQREGDQLQVIADGIRVSLDDTWRQLLDGNDNAERHREGLVLGVRPQHVSLQPLSEGEDENEADEGDDVPPEPHGAKLEVIEPLGAETYFYLKQGEHMVVAREEQTSFRTIGSAYQLALQPDAIHLFDQDTGAALPRPSSD